VSPHAQGGDEDEAQGDTADAEEGRAVRAVYRAVVWWGGGAGVSIFGHGQRGADALPLGMARVAPVYQPRDAEHTVLHQVIAEHLEAFLRAAAAAGDGAGLPQFVEREFWEFLTCGGFEHGVVRFRCEGCAREHLLPFSCKGRGWCPSCGGRRMTERAAHLVDAVLPWVPVRQWVLTVPYRLRYQMAWNHGLTCAVLRVYTRVLRWRARVVTYGRPAPEPTASTAALTAGPDGTGVKTASPRAWSWAALMRRAFGIDVLACAHCGGRLRLIATLHDPAVIRTILAHLALSHSGPSPGPGPPESDAVSP